MEKPITAKIPRNTNYQKRKSEIEKRDTWFRITRNEIRITDFELWFATQNSNFKRQFSWHISESLKLKTDFTFSSIELDILKLLKKGLHFKLIGDKLNTSQRMVSYHVVTVILKATVNSMIALVNTISV